MVQGNTDKEKPFIVHNNSTLLQSSTKLLVSTSAVLYFRIFSHDVTQAYLQRKDAMSRVIYVKPRIKDAALFGLKEDELMLVCLPVYGITDAGDYWGETSTAHVEKDLGMEPMAGDPALYIKNGDDGVEGTLGKYVDDTLLGGNEAFQVLTEKSLEAFESRPRTWDNVEFLGVAVETVPGSPRSFRLHQASYVAVTRQLPLDVRYERFVSARAGFAWLAHSRPDLCCAINRAAQVSGSSVCTRHVQELNKATKYARTTGDLMLTYTPLDRATLHLRVYADASFASNDDLSSQLGYIVLLCDRMDRCHVLTYSSKKARRFVRSIMAGEVYAFADAFDAAYIIKHDLERIYRQRLPLVMLTDSKQMFDVITRASHTTEKRLMIDVAAAREAYNRHEISNVGLVRSEHNVPDGLTKPGPCAALDAVLRIGKDVNPVQQWVIRSPVTPERSDGETPGV